jgi:hypothetical protein
MRLFIILTLCSSLAYAEDKQEIYIKSCHHTSMVVLMNIAKDAKQKYAELDAWSINQCNNLKNVVAINGWSQVQDPKLTGCIDGVDGTLGRYSDEQVRRKFRADLCL